MLPHASILVAAALLAITPLAQGDMADPEREIMYVAGDFIGIWCAEGGHQYVPIGDPDDYGTPVAWGFSGEPECLAGDALSGNGESAYAAFVVDAWQYLGGTATFSTRDDGFDAAPLEARVWLDEAGNLESVTGCGNLVVEIPEHPYIRPWFDEAAFLWTWLSPYQLDEDSLELCLGSTGTVEALVTPEATA